MEAVTLAQPAKIQMLVEQLCSSAPAVYPLLREGRIQGRAVMIPNG